MIIKCFRDGKEIDTPNNKNADYVIAQDTIVREPREVLLALKHNQATLAKRAMIKEVDGEGKPKYPSLIIDDSEYDAPEVPNVAAAKMYGEDLIRVVAVIKDKNIQKTGIVCPECYKDTDFVIWGIHKNAGV